MAEFKKITLDLNHNFDSKNNRHFINGNNVVFHCHHYTTLFTQLAIDANETEILKSSAEESFFKLLNNYFIENKISCIESKIEIACQYYSAIGLGNIEIKSAGEYSGEVISNNSHVDNGWIKKWGNFSKPVNYIGCGYISALFATIFNKPIGSYSTVEINSIVKGDSFSKFIVINN